MLSSDVIHIYYRTLPYSLSCGKAVVHTEGIHLIGGTKVGTDTSCPRNHYKWNGTTWNKIGNLIRSTYGCGVLHTAANTIGLYGGSDYPTQACYFDGTWHDASASLTVGFAYGGFVNYNDEARFIGGVVSPSTYISRTNGTVAKTIRLPYDFSHGCAVVYQGYIHIFGGTNDMTAHGLVDAQVYLQQ